MHSVRLFRRDAQATTADEVLARLRRRLPHALADVDRDTRLTELALDSLDFVELLCAAEDEFGSTLTEHEFAAARTVGDLADLIARRAAKNSTPRRKARKGSLSA